MVVRCSCFFTLCSRLAAGAATRRARGESGEQAPRRPARGPSSASSELPPGWPEMGAVTYTQQSDQGPTRSSRLTTSTATSRPRTTTSSASSRTRGSRASSTSSTEHDQKSRGRGRVYPGRSRSARNAASTTRSTSTSRTVPPVVPATQKRRAPATPALSAWIERATAITCSTTTSFEPTFTPPSVTTLTAPSRTRPVSGIAPAVTEPGAVHDEPPGCGAFASVTVTEPSAGLAKMST